MSNHRGKASVVALLPALMAWSAATPAMAVNDLRLNVSGGAQTVEPGDIVYVTLDVANLSAAINGVQALMHYNDAVLALLSVTPIDLGLTPPAEGWVEVALTDVGGDLVYAVVINDGSTLAAGTVATFVFEAVGEGTTSITFRPDSDPFYTKLTRASNNTTILPTKADSQVITSTCSDGLYCNGEETLVGGSCQPGTPPNCGVLTNQCNNGVCNEVADACQAQPINEGGGCNDQNLCTQNDRCASGVCAGTAVDCSYLNDGCIVGQCDPADGLCDAVSINEGGSCNDGVFCNGADTCHGGLCESAGDPCAPLLCDEASDVCMAPIHVDALEVFYSGWFGDAPDPSKVFLGTGVRATIANITNYYRGITGIRVYFDQVVTFATTPQAAFAFAWTTGNGTTFSPVTNPSANISVSASVQDNATVVTIDLADNFVRRRWLKVTINAAQVTVNGVALDGELSGNPVGLPSGNGTAGGNAVFHLGNVTGDVDGNRKTELTDVGLIRSVVNPFWPVPITNAYDVDKDGKVLLTDVGRARLDVNPFFALPLITP